MANENFNTFGDVVSEAFNELAIDSGNSVPGLSQANMEKWGNRFAKIFVEKVKLQTQEETYSFRTVADTTLSAAPSSGASTVTVASVTGFPASGAILIDGTPYVYDSIATLTITLNSSYTLDRDYSSGDDVQLLYAVPSDYGKHRSFYVSGAPYALQKWGSSEEVSSRHFSIHENYYVLPPAMGADQDVISHYYAKATNTLTDSSSMEIYQMWDAYVIYRLAARGYRLLYDSDKGAEYDGLAREILAMAKNQIATEDNSQNLSFQPGW